MAGRIIQMQSGFAMLESAYAQPNNAANIMMKNLLDLCIGVLAFYVFGYTIAYGETEDVGIADAGFDLAHWFCCFSYATTAATINSGALAGRVAFFPYLALSTMMTGLVYPISARLVWGGGWLQQMGFVDFAGSATVHLVGAVSALVSTMICGPRIGRFPEYRAWRKPLSWIFGEKHNDQYYRVPEDPVEKKVFIPFRRCRHPVQLLFGTFLLHGLFHGPHSLLGGPCPGADQRRHRGLGGQLRLLHGDPAAHRTTGRSHCVAADAVGGRTLGLCASG